MPRTNPARSLFSEDELARRVALEREQRGWTYEGMARRMTAAGCPINQSALYKIEKGTKRKDGEPGPARRITVDELVAMARVFGLPVEQLLLPAEVAAVKDVGDLLRAWRAAADAAEAADDAAEEAWADLLGYVQAHPEVESGLPELLQRWAVDAYETYSPQVQDEAAAYLQHRLTGSPEARLAWLRAYRVEVNQRG